MVFPILIAVGMTGAAQAAEEAKKTLLGIA